MHDERVALQIFRRLRGSVKLKIVRCRENQRHVFLKREREQVTLFRAVGEDREVHLPRLQPLHPSA